MLSQKKNNLNNGKGLFRTDILETLLNVVTKNPKNILFGNLLTFPNYTYTVSYCMLYA